MLHKVFPLQTMKSKMSFLLIMGVFNDYVRFYTIQCWVLIYFYQLTENFNLNWDCIFLFFLVLSFAASTAMISKAKADGSTFSFLTFFGEKKGKRVSILSFF